MPVFEDESGTHVFSEYTLQSFAQIETLIRCGAQRFRIDSIFHDDAWSVLALNDYRAVLAHQLSLRRQPQDANAMIRKAATAKAFIIRRPVW